MEGMGRKWREREGPAASRVAEGHKNQGAEPSESQSERATSPRSEGLSREGNVSLPQVSSSRYSLRQAGSGSCCTAWGRKRRPSERRTA